MTLRARRSLGAALLAAGACAVAAQTTGRPAVPAAGPAGGAADRAQNVLVVTLDGMRWQEVFSGFDPTLATEKDGGVKDREALARHFAREGPLAAREALLPFLWTVVAREGQVFGDPSLSSAVRVTNGLWFSYPGYNELLAGVSDPRIDSNDKKTNPNLTVLEWLNRRPGYEDRVAVFGTWDVFPSILAVERSRLPVHGYDPPFPAPASEREQLIDDFSEDLPEHWGGVRLDAVAMQAALECLRAHQPRVLAVLLGETDEWAHERRYDQYLEAAHRAARFVRRLWETAQSLPAYRGRTALLLATDHGRGDTPRDWTDHGRSVPAAERIWLAALGPGTPPLGVRQGVSATQSQFAATIAAVLGEDFRTAVPQAAPPLPDVGTARAGP